MLPKADMTTSSYSACANDRVMLIPERFNILRLDKVHHYQPDDIGAHLSPCVFQIGALKKATCPSAFHYPTKCKHKGILQCPERSLASESSLSVGDAEPESSATGKTSALEGSIKSTYPLALRYWRTG